MKKTKRLFAMLIAMVMVLGMSTSVFAAALPEGTAGADKTITITTPSGLADTDKVTYTVYKVFDATANGTAISYKLLKGAAAAPAGFIVDDGGNVYLGTSSTTATEADGEIETMVGGIKTYIVPQTTELTQTQIDAIEAYTSKVEVGTVEITGPSTAKTVTVPDYGYYYITTTTGSLVVINSTNKSASVTDKNSIPTLDKKITGATSYDEDGKKALAQVGTVVKYEVKIVVGKGAVNYVFHDIMDAGLSYNNDVAVTPTKDGEGDDATTIVKNTTTAEGDTLTVAFNDGIKEGTGITIKYSATVTSDALQDDPANNTATLDYGNNYTTSESVTEVYNAKFTVTKNDGEGKALAGAGFVIKNAAGKYYKLNAAAAAVEDDPDTEEDESAAATEASVSWVDSIDDATEYTSDAQGAVPAFTGLANGTYTLVEKTVPAGYNKAADSTFTVMEHAYNETNLKQESTVVNNAGAELPSTGGMGTTIFYALGAVLVIGAGVVLVTRRRKAQ